VPGSANTYIPVVPAVFRIRLQSGQWIRIWIDIQLKCWMDPDSVNPDPRHWVKVPTHVVSAAPGSADTHISVGTGTYSPRQCAWIRRYLHTCKQWWAKLLRLLTVNSLSYFVKLNINC